MIITEAMVVTEGARNHTNSLCLFHDRYIPGLAAIVDAIHAGGALAVGQLNHRGALLKRSVLGMEPVAPSAWHNPNTGEPARALALAEIAAIQRDFLDSARRLYRAGYDAVELHAANGYLFQQFFSPRINRRDDGYGGPLENRMRFLLETVGLIRAGLPDFPLMVRVSATEYCEGGYSEADMIALCQALERAGVIAIDMSGGSNESPQLSRYCIQPPSFARRFLEPYARPIAAGARHPDHHGGARHRSRRRRGHPAGGQRRVRGGLPRAGRRCVLAAQGVRRDRHTDPQVHIVQRLFRAPDARARRGVRGEPAGRHRVRGHREGGAAVAQRRRHAAPGRSQARAGAGRGRRRHRNRARRRGARPQRGGLGEGGAARRPVAARAGGARQGRRRRHLDLPLAADREPRRAGAHRRQCDRAVDPRFPARSGGGRDRRQAARPAVPGQDRRARAAGVGRAARSRARAARCARHHRRRRHGRHRDRRYADPLSRRQGHRTSRAWR